MRDRQDKEWRGRLDFDLLEGNKSHTVIRLRDEEGKDYTDVIEIHMIELRKLQDEKEQFVHQNTHEYERNRDSKDAVEENNIEEWIRFFKCRTEEDVKMLLQKTKNRGVKEAIKELNLVNASDKLRARYEAKLKARRDRNAEDAYVLEQGIEQGIERGIEKGITQGEAYFAALTEKLLQDGRLEDLAKITKDQDYREQLYREYGMKSPASEKKLRNDK